VLNPLSLTLEIDARQSRLYLGGAELPEPDPCYAAGVRAWRIVRPGQQGGDETVLIDSGGHAHRIYGDGLVLVRPDGYLGYAGPGDSGARLVAYLAQFFGRV